MSFFFQISGHKNIQSITSYSKLNSNAHKNISKTLLTTSDESTVPEKQNVEQITFMSSQESVEQIDFGHKLTKTVRQSQTSSQNVVRTSRTENRTIVGTPFSGIFNAPIYGGTFNIYLKDDTVQVPRKRRRIIESDTDSD